MHICPPKILWVQSIDQIDPRISFPPYLSDIDLQHAMLDIPAVVAFEVESERLKSLSDSSRMPVANSREESPGTS